MIGGDLIEANSYGQASDESSGYPRYTEDGRQKHCPRKNRRITKLKAQCAVGARMVRGPKSIRHHDRWDASSKHNGQPTRQTKFLTVSADAPRPGTTRLPSCEPL